MRKLLSISALLLSLCFGGQAYAAGSPPANMTASGAIVGTQIVWCPTGLTADLKCTFTQIAAYINSLVSGDCIANGTGTFTCTKTNGVAFTALATTAPGTGVATALGVNVGSAGAFVTFNGALGTPSAGTLTNATGLPIGGLSGLGTGIGSWLATPSSANLAAALTDETGSGAAVFGTAPTISSLNATVAATLAFITGSTQCLQVNTSGVISGTGAVCGGSGSSGANPTATAADVAVNGAASTFMRSDAAPAVQKASSSVFGIIKVDGSTITASGGVISSVGGSSTITAGSTATSGIATGNIIGSAGNLVTDAGIPYASVLFSRPAYIVNNWYAPYTFASTTTGVVSAINRITCSFGAVPNKVTVNAIGARITTAGSTNVQFALYQDNGGVPGTLLSNTGNIVNTSTGAVSGALGANKQIGPGGADGNEKIWWCHNSGDGSVIMTGYAGGSQMMTAAMGSATLGNAIGAGVSVTAKQCTGAACQGGSSTLGTWPADLHTSTFSDVTGAIAALVFQVTSVP